MTRERDVLLRRNALLTVRGRIAAMVKPRPDSSHGEDYTNHGLTSALRVLDYALDARCEFRPTAYGSWCELHHSPVDTDRPLVDGRCGGYQYVRDQVLA